MVGDHAVEQVNIVLAQILQVEELVNRSVLQSQLGEAASLLGFVALGARWCEAICAQVLANVGRVGSVIVGISISSKEENSVSGYADGKGSLNRPMLHG